MGKPEDDMGEPGHDGGLPPPPSDPQHPELRSAELFGPQVPCTEMSLPDKGTKLEMQGTVTGGSGDGVDKTFFF